MIINGEQCIGDMPITKDFVNFEHLPIALYPSKDFDRNGCFSGSAIEIDGQLYLITQQLNTLKKIQVMYTINTVMMI